MKVLTLSKDVATTTNIPELVEEFIDVIWMERGLSENTLSAYRTDLKFFSL